MKLSDLAILIPTLNRSSFLIRQLEYYESHGFKGTIYIGDQSRDHHFWRVADWVQNSTMNVCQCDFRGKTWASVYTVLPKMIQEPLLVLSADDDFVVMEGMKEAVRHPVANFGGGIVGPEWYVHHLGKWATLRTPGYREQSLHGDVEERDKVFRAGWFPVLYGIWPTKLVRDALLEVPFQNMRQYEYETSCALVKKTTCTLIPTPISIRVHHSGQISLTGGESYSWRQRLDDMFPLLVQLGADLRGEKPPECVRKIMKLLGTMPIEASDYQIKAELT